jgi:hypothetical protein
MRNDMVGPIVSERDDGSSEEPGCIHGCTRKILLIEIRSLDCRRRHDGICGCRVLPGIRRGVWSAKGFTGGEGDYIAGNDN